MQNVILIMSDQQTYHMVEGVGPHPVQTPNLKRFAAEGTTFTNAYTPSPVCVPARFAALSGLYPSQSGCIHNRTPLPIRTKTMAHHFAKAGYLTAFIGKMHPVDAQTHGFDYYIDFGHYHDYLGPKSEVFARGLGADDSGKGMPWIDIYQKAENSWNFQPIRDGLPTSLADEDHFEAFVVRESLRFLQTYHDEPIFLFVSFLRPHTPLSVPEPFASQYLQTDVTLPKTISPDTLNPYLKSRIVPNFKTKEIQEKAINHLRHYMGAVSYVDSQVGHLLRGLQKLNLEDKSILAYTSDHGDMLFSHQMFGKFTFYEPSVRVPLLIKGPNLPQGQIVSTPIDHTDLLPTLLAAAGVTWTGAPNLLGKNALDQTSQVTKDAFSELPLAQGGTMHMLRHGEYKLNRYPDGFSQLFHLTVDPDEELNLIHEHPQVAADLTERLAEHVARVSPISWRGIDPTS